MSETTSLMCCTIAASALPLITAELLAAVRVLLLFTPPAVTALSATVTSTALTLPLEVLTFVETPATVLEVTSPVTI